MAKTPDLDPKKYIIIKGAQLNLKILMLYFQNKLTVVTGLSGSGKSSLVFDTLYAEGQRRYVETSPRMPGSLWESSTNPKLMRLKELLPPLL